MTTLPPSGRLGACALLLLTLTAGAAFAQPYAYVLGQRDDPAPGNSGVQTIVVIDTATSTRVATIDAGVGCQCIAPHAITASRDGSEVYAANEIGNSVTVLDTATRSVVATLPFSVVGNAPVGVVVSPDNQRLYVLSGSGTTAVFVIDRASRTRIGEVLLEVAQARSMAISPDGTRLYVGTYGSHSVKVIDTATLTVTATILTPQLPIGMAMRPDGQRLYVSGFLGNAVGSIDTATNAMTPINGFLQPSAVAVSPDGARGYTADNGQIGVFNPVNDTLTGAVSNAFAVRDIAFTPDGTRAFAAASTEVYIVDVATQMVIGSIPLGASTEGSGASIVMVEGGAPPENPPPFGLRVASVAGNDVLLRWTAPLTGTPTGYVVEGGVAPGEVLASLPTGSTTPAFRFTAPNGAFYVRVHAVTASGRSLPSNEVRLFVNSARPPSAPAGLLGTVNGSTVTLSWRNTFEGGAPTDNVLNVSGALNTAILLGGGQSFSFAGVPAGTYTLALRSRNAAGVSQLSQSLTLTFPGACSGTPLAPTEVLATRSGRRITVMWEPPASGPAPSGYVLQVTGGYNGNLTTGARTLAGDVGPGTYNLSVIATNACGQSTGTPVQTIVVP